MDERLINLYEQELRHLRETAAEFGRAFPARAGALALAASPPDPYVERLLEGVAFLAARVRLKLDAQFPQFTQSLLESCYPDFLAPLPAMALLQLRPDPASPPPPGGTLVEREKVRVSVAPASAGADAPTANRRSPATFTLAQDVRILPVEIVSAEVLVRRLHETGVERHFEGAGAALRLRLRRTVSAPWGEIALDPLVVHTPSHDGLGHAILRNLFAHSLGICLRDGEAPGARMWFRKGTFDQRGPLVGKVGYDRASALLPPQARVFEGYRLLREYFAFPDRFLFFSLSGFGAWLAECKSDVVELIVPLKMALNRLEQEVDVECFKLFCAPAINLFPKRFCQVIEPDRFSEFHVVPDANRTLDFEVYSVNAVEGFTSSSPMGRTFRPFYQTRGRSRDGAFFTVNRQSRLVAEAGAGPGREAAATAYPGSEVFLALVDAQQAPFAGDLQELEISTLCTNRHLPITLRDANGQWQLTGGVKSEVVALVGPTVPVFQPVDGDYAWRLLNLFSLNCLSLSNDDQDGAAGLRELLGLFATDPADWAARQIECIRQVRAAPVLRPLYERLSPDQPPSILGTVRGLEVAVELEENALGDDRLFLLGAVLEEFFAKYVALNSFTETVFKTWPRQSEWMRWPSYPGLRPTL